LTLPSRVGADRIEAEAVLDRREDRRRVVLGAVHDEVALEMRRDDERRDPCAGPPLVERAVAVPLAGRRDVIPLAAELVVGDDDHRVLRAAAVLDVLQEVDEVVAALRLAGVAGVLVLFAERLDEAHRRQLAVVPLRPLRGRDERLLVLQMCAAGRVERLEARVDGVRPEVVERLVVVLEQEIRTPRERRVGRAVVRVAARRAVPVRPARAVDGADRVRPAARVPGPRNACLRQAVTAPSATVPVGV
jgi:hypothetical protein